MPFLKHFPFKRQEASDIVLQPAGQENDIKTSEATVESPTPVADSENDKYVPDGNAQSGVKKVEAVTLSWTRPELIVAYVS
jgi:hypothetical protein